MARREVVGFTVLGPDALLKAGWKLRKSERHGWGFNKGKDRVPMSRVAQQFEGFPKDFSVSEKAVESLTVVVKRVKTKALGSSEEFRILSDGRVLAGCKEFSPRDVLVIRDALNKAAAIKQSKATKQKEKRNAR
jgi:hypothetical protein